MQEIKIKRGLEFVNGGCNACPTFKEDIYVMELKGNEHVLDEFNVNSMVMAIAVANGYKLHQEYDMSEDYDIYKKEGNEIAVIPEYNKLIFKKGPQQQKVANHYQNTEELFAVVNNLLTQYFDLESIQFVLEK
ncbi:MAG: DUF4809 family protein [Vagococcus sp.]|uniref:DUF4809 family protein n=1 Tax=Vagococcus TaxID=2737 RepID=UPI002FC98596